jgi:ankyrin repeat protein
MASVGEALISACVDGQAREVGRLLSGGADINDADEQGLTPLMVASNYGHVEVVDMLLAAEANVHAADDSGGTALYHASFKGQLVIVQHLLASGADLSVMISN